MDATLIFPRMVKGHRLYLVRQIDSAETWYIKHALSAWRVKQYVRTLDAAKKIAQRMEEEKPTKKGVGLVRATMEADFEF